MTKLRLTCILRYAALIMSTGVIFFFTVEVLYLNCHYIVDLFSICIELF